MSEDYGPHNAIWDDGEWVGWEEINSHLARMELESRFPNAVDVALVPIFEDLLQLASRYHLITGRHLQLYGDIGEIFGAIMFGIRPHKVYAKGSDGRLGNDFVEIKTITPFKGSDEVIVRADRHFSKVLVVKIDADFGVEGRIVERKRLGKPRRGIHKLRWSDLTS